MTGSAEALIGGGIYGLLLLFTLQLLRRTKDTDERRDRLTEVIAQQEREASKERNQLAAEVESLRAEIRRMKERDEPALQPGPRQ